MAAYQPRRAAIATILATVMQDDICEELLGRHKRGRTEEWMRRRYEKGMYRLVVELRADKKRVAYKMIRINYETFREILMAIEPPARHLHRYILSSEWGRQQYLT